MNRTDQTELHARRHALSGTGYTVTFYGGWYVIEKSTGNTLHANSMLDAIEQAEGLNQQGVA